MAGAVKTIMAAAPSAAAVWQGTKDSWMEDPKKFIFGWVSFAAVAGLALDKRETLKEMRKAAPAYRPLRLLADATGQSQPPLVVRSLKSKVGSAKSKAETRWSLLSTPGPLCLLHLATQARPGLCSDPNSKRLTLSYYYYYPANGRTWGFKPVALGPIGIVCAVAMQPPQSLSSAAALLRLW
eukprot:gene7712-1380_t